MESFRVEIKVIPVESQSEDSEGLDRRSDLGNNTETQSENSETTPWDLPVMPAPDAGDLSKKIQKRGRRRSGVDAISPLQALRGEEQWKPFGPLGTDLTTASISGVGNFSNPREEGQWRNDLTPISEFQDECERE